MSREVADPQPASSANGRSQNLGDLVRSFLEYCEVDRGHSPLTVQNYAHYLERFLEFCEEKNIHAPGEITLEVIHNYRLWLNRLKSDSPSARLSDTPPVQQVKKYILPSEASLRASARSSPQTSRKLELTSARSSPLLSPTTQNYHLIAVRSFLKFLARRDVASLSHDRIELADTPDQEITFLEPEELERLLAAPKPTNLIGARDAAILALLFSTGLRVAELTSLDREQINLKNDEFSVIGKGGKARLVFLSDYARGVLANYLKRRRDKDPALFVRHGKKGLNSEKIPKTRVNTGDNYQINVNAKPSSLLRLTPRSVQRLVKKYARLAGINKDIHPHTLRHTFATDLLGNGADIRSVQQLLGHSSIVTTQIYTHVTNKQLREVHKKFHAKHASSES